MELTVSDRRTDGQTDGQTDGRTDKVSYRGACYAPKNVSCIKSCMIKTVFCFGRHHLLIELPHYKNKEVKYIYYCL